MPRREDIEVELANATVFSKLDARAGFHQILLRDKTLQFCMFGTPSGDTGF